MQIVEVPINIYPRDNGHSIGGLFLYVGRREDLAHRIPVTQREEVIGKLGPSRYLSADIGAMPSTYFREPQLKDRIMSAGYIAASILTLRRCLPNLYPEDTFPYLGGTTNLAMASFLSRMSATTYPDATQPEKYKVVIVPIKTLKSQETQSFLEGELARVQDILRRRYDTRLFFQEVSSIG